MKEGILNSIFSRLGAVALIGWALFDDPNIYIKAFILIYIVIISVDQVLRDYLIQDVIDILEDNDET